MTEGPPDIPPHIAETVRAIALLHAEYHRKATFAERVVDRTTAAVGRPIFLFALLIAGAFWIGVNEVVGKGEAPDPPPFGWLSLALTAAALVIAVLIITSQRRADRLADLREQMTLEATLLTEQKTRKIIELLEELRLDHPEIRNRIDSEAAQMASKSDPHAMLNMIEKTTEQAARSAKHQDGSDDRAAK